MVMSVSASRVLVKNSFARACSAYCYITIPSITSPLVKLQLYILTGQTSLLNGCLGQGITNIRHVRQLPVNDQYQTFNFSGCMPESSVNHN